MNEIKSIISAKRHAVITKNSACCCYTENEHV